MTRQSYGPTSVHSSGAHPIPDHSTSGVQTTGVGLPAHILGLLAGTSCPVGPNQNACAPINLLSPPSFCLKKDIPIPQPFKLEAQGMFWAPSSPLFLLPLIHSLTKPRIFCHQTISQSYICRFMAIKEKSSIPFIPLIVQAKLSSLKWTQSSLSCHTCPLAA